MRDLYHNILPVTTFAPAAKTADVTGTGVDLAGFEGAVATVNAGVITDGTHTPKLQESDSASTGFTDVAAGDQLGSFAALVTGGSGNGSVSQSVGYIGSKRYLNVYVTVSAATTGGVYGATITKGFARHLPVTLTQAP